MHEGPLVPAEEDVGLLAMVVAEGFSMRVLARLAELGFGDTRMSHGYVVQGLLAGDRTVTDLAERLGISVQAVSKTVREMERLGYLERETNPNDRRSGTLKLSARGEASVRASREARFDLMDQLLESLGPEDCAALIRLLGKAAAQFGGLEVLRQRRVRPPA
jgi:DNA-binding MarR family transcriptional regulator